MATPATPSVGSSATSSLSDWAGGYVTDMLGKAQAVASEPYRVYQGPMTAGESGLQSKVFQGLGGLNFPSNLGQSFSSPMGGQQPQTMPAYRGQQPYPAQIPGTGGGMLTLYSGGRPTDVMGGDYTGGKGFSPGQPARYDEGTGGGMAMPYKSNMSELLGSLGMGGAGAKPTGMPMQEAMPDYASMGMAGLASRATPTEADWNKFASKARFASEADMEKSKANFLAGGQGGPGGGMLTPYSGKTPDYATGGDYTGGKGTDMPFAQKMGQLGMAPQQGGDTDLTMPFMGAPTGQKFGMSDLMSGLGGAEMPQLNQLDPSVSRPTMPMGGSYGNTPEDMGAYNPAGSMPMGGGILGTAQTGMPPQGGIAGLTPPQASQQPSNIAQSYMNPYLQSVLDPQMAELRRQNDITNMQANAKLTGAGAFGGGRQAIMNAENNRNLMQEMNKTVGQGYASAYDKAMGQFNTEQGQARDLANLMSTQGAQQRDIEQQGISADYNEFLAQRDDPMKKTQYLQSMLQGLPISTVSNQAAQQSGIGQLASTVGGLGNIMESLKRLGL